MLGAFRPIVVPADDYIAPCCRMAVIAETPALEFKFDLYALPAVGADATLGFAIGESVLDRFDDIAQFFGEHSEQQDDSLFVNWFMTQPAEIDGVAIRGLSLERPVLLLGAGRGRRIGLLWSADLHRRGGGKESDHIGPFRFPFGEIAKHAGNG